MTVNSTPAAGETHRTGSSPRQNAAPPLSVVLTQYRPDRKELKHALDSLLMQDTRDFELIVTDDASPQDYFAETRAYLARHGFTDVRFCKNKTNRGTVINFLHGVEAARGQWIFGHSLGDPVYDPATLRWVIETAQRDDPAMAFGKTAGFSRTADGQLAPHRGQTPFDRTCYQPPHYDNRRIKRNLLLYSDFISGAGTFYRRDALLAALRRMQGRVKYAEDFCTLLFATEGTRMHCYDRILRWYEYGTGISTDKNSASERRLHEDLKAMLLLLREQFPGDRTVWLAYQYFFNDRHKSRLLRGLIGRAIVPQWLPFKRAQKSWQPPTNGDLQNLLDIYAYDQGDEL